MMTARSSMPHTFTVISLILAIEPVCCFFTSPINVLTRKASLLPPPLCMACERNDHASGDRRAALQSLGAIGTSLFLGPKAATASVFFDPACYGDQESRSGAVGGCESRIREAISRNPQLARSFFKLALLDGLSFDSVSKDTPGGPDGSIVPVILGMNAADNAELALMQDACKVVIEISKQRNKKDIKTVTLLDAVTIPDAIALGGTAAIESIGGPILSVQIGRTEPDSLRPALANLKSVKPRASTASLIKAFTQDNRAKDPGLDSAVEDAFAKAGLTDRELSVLLGALLVLEKVELKDNNPNYKKPKAKLRERGKIGRASDFKKLTDAEFEAANSDDDEEGDADEDEPYIVDSFGTRGEIYGAKATKTVDSNTFNKYFGSIADFKRVASSDDFWHERILSKTSARQVVAGTYAKSNLKYLKDLRTAYNSVTQLGAKFTGGKYESLLGNKKRKTLNDLEE